MLEPFGCLSKIILEAHKMARQSENFYKSINDLGETRQCLAYTIVSRTLRSYKNDSPRQLLTALRAH